MIKSRLAFYYFVVVALLLLSGCNGAPTIIEKPYPVYYPGIHDTIYMSQDTVYSPIDSNAYWEGNVEDSLKNVIGWLKVYYNKKIAELKLSSHTDSIIVNDTIPSKPITIVETVYGLLPQWAQLAMMLLCGVLLYFSAKSQTTTNLVLLIKNLIKKII